MGEHRFTVHGLRKVKIFRIFKFSVTPRRCLMSGLIQWSKLPSLFVRIQSLGRESITGTMFEVFTLAPKSAHQVSWTALQFGPSNLTCASLYLASSGHINYRRPWLPLARMTMGNTLPPLLLTYMDMTTTTKQLPSQDTHSATMPHWSRNRDPQLAL